MRALSVVGVVLLVAGCAAGSAHPPAPTTNPLTAAHSVTAAACVLVRQDDAITLFGHTAARVAVENKVRAASVCGYSASSNSDPNTIDNITDSLLVYVFDGSTHFTQSKASDSTPIAGLGDGAFQVVRGDLLSVAFMAKGQSVEIDFSITGLSTHPAAGASGAQLVAIAHLAAGRM